MEAESVASIFESGLSMVQQTSEKFVSRAGRFIVPQMEGKSQLRDVFRQDLQD